MFLDIEERKRKVGLFLLLASLISVFMPFKIVAYVLPYVLLTVVMVLCPLKVMFVRLFIMIISLVVYLSIWTVFYSDFILFNGLVSIFTWSGLLAALIIPSNIFSDVEFKNIWKWVVPISVLELLVGFSQALFGFSRTGGFDGSTGDYIEGTIHLPLESSLSFSNPMFAVGLLILITYVVVQQFHSKNKSVLWLLAPLILLLLLCSVTHITILAIFSFLIAYFLVHRRRLLSARTVLVLCLMPIFIAFLGFIMPRNFSNILNIFSDGAFFEGYKVLAWDYMFRELESPFGFGVGQLASKAAFMSSGLMHNGSISFFNDGNMSESFRQIIEPLWAFMNMDFKSPGSGQTPFSSWLGFISEFGVLAFIVIFLGLKKLLLVLSYEREGGRVYQYTLVALSLSIFLIGYQDLYWESPQIIFAFALTAKYMYSQVRKGLDVDEARYKKYVG